MYICMYILWVYAEFMQKFKELYRNVYIKLIYHHDIKMISPYNKRYSASFFATYWQQTPTKSAPAPAGDERRAAERTRAARPQPNGSEAETPPTADGAQKRPTSDGDSPRRRSQPSQHPAEAAHDTPRPSLLSPPRQTSRQKHRTRRQIRQFSPPTSQPRTSAATVNNSHSALIQPRPAALTFRKCAKNEMSKKHVCTHFLIVLAIYGGYIYILSSVGRLPDAAMSPHPQFTPKSKPSSHLFSLSNRILPPNPSYSPTPKTRKPHVNTNKIPNYLPTK